MDGLRFRSCVGIVVDAATKNAVRDNNVKCNGGAQNPMASDVVIVGGGLAGLSLAHRFGQERLDYLLLEARDRFGGRILSKSSDKGEESNDRHDLGPSWIWPGQPRIARLIRELDLRTFRQHSQGTLAYEEANGSVRRDFDYSAMAGSLRIERGVASITDALADVLCKQKLLLSHAVTRVSKDGDSFSLAVTTANGESNIRARWVVLALPPRVAERTITFDPPLSRDVTDALRAVPTWMAGHAKLVAVYDQPFWRKMGLSGDGISRRGPLMEIHDATPASGETGALFGFVGVPAGSQQRERSTLLDNAVSQLEAMFGAKASNPVDVFVKDWANDRLTATTDDEAASQHPLYGPPAAIADLVDDRLLFASSEMGSQFAGLLEGALEASEVAAQKIISAEAERT